MASLGEYSKNSNNRSSSLTAPYGGTSYFQGARNLRFADLSITNVHGDYYNTFAGSLSGLSALHQQISENAMFDSAARYSSGRCHPGTRMQILETIMDWIHDPSPPESIIWLSGTAGIGKSSIMQTIAEILNKEAKELYAASFFFAHDVEGRREGSALIPTLAYQIAVNLPGMRELVDQAMERDRTLPTKSLAVQMQSLIIDPLKKSNKEFFQHSPTVLIDGLDECQDSTTQCQLLNIISEALRVNNIPLRFIIASRPAYWIKNTFEGDSLCHITKQFSLNDLQFAAMTTVNSDIATFLQESFDEIYAKHPDLMANVKRPWPSSDIIDRLVYEASGQFIYASTIIKFVGHSSDFCDPVRQLELLLIDSPSRLHAFSELDLLYTRILSVHPRPESLKAVLGGILLGLLPLNIQHVLGVDRSELIITLNSLSSVVDRLDRTSTEVDKDLASIFSPPGSKTNLKFSHKSFIDYLSDSRRSGPFSIDLRPIFNTISAVFINSIRKALEGREETHSDLIYYRDLSKTLIHPQFGRERLVALLHNVKEQVEDYVKSPTAPLSSPATLLRFLPSVQMLIDQNLIPGFHDFANITLDHDVYPKIVKSMHESDALAITDNHIYFSSPIFDVAELQTLSPRLGSGSGAASPKTFLLENTGIVTYSYEVLPRPGTSGSIQECYFIEPYIRNVLENGTNDFQVQYRLHFIHIALQCLRYILEVYRQPPSLEKFPSVIPCMIIARFLDTPQLSDIRDEQDLRNITFVSLISSIMEDRFLKSNATFGFNQLWRRNDWQIRQRTNIHTMDLLKELQPNLATKMMEIESDRLQYLVNNMIASERHRRRRAASPSARRGQHEG